jgi:hypothetical protein
MASYNLKYNSDDSVVRHVIIGLLADLNNKVYFWRQLNENDRVAIDIPFYYSITGDDQFLRDNFLFTTTTGVDCHPDQAFADANYDAVPRGVVSLTGMSIDSGKLVNKRNMGTYTKMNEAGAMEGYSAEFEMIPVTLGIDVEILVSSTLDAFKVTEMLIKRLYKSNSFNVEVGHLNEATYRLNSYYSMPDDYDIQRPIDYTFEDKDKYKITFPIEINTSIPSFDWESERHAGNRMFEINSHIIPESDKALNTTGELVIVDENGLSSKPVNSALGTSTPFNYDEILNPQKVQGVDTIIPLNGTLNPGLIQVEQGSYNQEAILLATNDTVTIDTSNFAGATSISIAEGGAVNIKFYNGKWYVVSSSNSIINY